ncbi:MAG TPA: hypothetical protein VM260_05990 [Pirellula sp.]|nr:hypothetical protein [Pirellula sp.]
MLVIQVVDQAVIHAEHQHVAQARAVAPKWLLAEPVVEQLQAVDLAVARKSLHAILAELHLAIADVVTNTESVVCSLRFSSAKAKAAAMHLQAAIPVAIHAGPRAVAVHAVAVQQYRLQWLLQWLLQHPLLTHMPTSTPNVMSFKQAAPEFVNSNSSSLSQDMI